MVTSVILTPENKILEIKSLLNLSGVKITNDELINYMSHFIINNYKDDFKLFIYNIKSKTNPTLQIKFDASKYSQSTMFENWNESEMQSIMDMQDFLEDLVKNTRQLSVEEGEYFCDYYNENKKLLTKELVYTYIKTRNAQKDEGI